MAPRSNPTARQARLGTELRRMRERAGLSSREAAQRLGVSPMQMSHMEVGRIGVGADRVRALAAQYRCDDEALVEALVAMTGRRPRGWWEDYRDIPFPVLLDLAELEHYALGLRVFQMVHVPGLLQTEGYIRALHSNAPNGLCKELVDVQVDFRLRRQTILDRVRPPEACFVVHEAALRIKVGDAATMREQLTRLLEGSHRPSVDLRLIPFGRDRFAGAGYSMFYANAAVPRLDTAQFDTVTGSVFVDEEDQLAEYRNVYTLMERAALSVDKSRDLVNRLLREL